MAQRVNIFVWPLPGLHVARRQAGQVGLPGSSESCAAGCVHDDGDANETDEGSAPVTPHRSGRNPSRAMPHRRDPGLTIMMAKPFNLGKQGWARTVSNRRALVCKAATQRPRGLNGSPRCRSYRSRVLNVPPRSPLHGSLLRVLAHSGHTGGELCGSFKGRRASSRSQQHRLNIVVFRIAAQLQITCADFPEVAADEHRNPTCMGTEPTTRHACQRRQPLP